MLAGGLKSYTHMRIVNEAFRMAFKDRLGPGELHSPRRRMIDIAEAMMRDARQNAAQSRKREAA